MLAKKQIFVEAFTMSKIRAKPLKNRLCYARMSVDKSAVESLSVFVKLMPKGFDEFKYLLDTACELANSVLAILIRTRVVQIVAKRIIVCTSGQFTLLNVGSDSAFMSVLIEFLLREIGNNKPI